MPSVMLDWVSNLSYMQQSVLITAVRGADGIPKTHVSKYLLRWLRRCIMLSAFDRVALMTDPHDTRGGNFTGPIPRGKTLEMLAEEYFTDHDGVPHHFHLHLIHAAEILGYKHPINQTRLFWFQFYYKAARDMHMTPETEEELDFRLGDNIGQWQQVGGEVLDMGRV